MAHVVRPGTCLEENLGAKFCLPRRGAQTLAAEGLALLVRALLLKGLAVCTGRSEGPLSSEGRVRLVLNPSLTLDCN